MAISGKLIAVGAAGAILSYSGIKGIKVGTTVRGLVQGTDPSTITPDNPVGTNTAVQTAAFTLPKLPNLKQAGAPAPIVAGAPGSSAANNQNIGRMLATQYGWGSGTEWSDLIALWNQESGWSNTAKNPKSGAYGIPQSLPYSKMPRAAWPPEHGGQSDPAAQIKWGLRYIRSRYGSPSKAWAHEQQVGWY